MAERQGRAVAVVPTRGASFGAGCDALGGGFGAGSETQTLNAGSAEVLFEGGARARWYKALLVVRAKAPCPCLHTHDACSSFMLMMQDEYSKQCIKHHTTRYALARTRDRFRT